MQKAEYDFVPFGRRLHRAIKVKGMTQRAFARAVGVDEALISKYVLEEYYPKVQKLVKFAKYLDVSTDFLLGLTDKMR